MERLEKLHLRGMDIKDIEADPNGDGYIIYYKSSGRKKSGKPATISKDKILKLRNEGLSCRKIAEQVGCSHVYVSQIIKKEMNSNGKDSSI